MTASSFHFVKETGWGDPKEMEKIEICCFKKCSVSNQNSKPYSSQNTDDIKKQKLKVYDLNWFCHSLSLYTTLSINISANNIRETYKIHMQRPTQI